jgi:hypothetical protein
MDGGKAHIVAMTGSYFRGDTLPVLRPEDEEKFIRVSYTYYEQLNGYRDLKTLGIGYHFYRGHYGDAIGEILDSTKKRSFTFPLFNRRHPADINTSRSIASSITLATSLKRTQ